MTHKLYIIIALYAVLINISAFLLYGSDKKRARSGAWRIPESRLMGVAVIGGSVGAFLGMKYFRHKTKHKKFMIGVPLIIIVQILLLVKYFF